MFFRVLLPQNERLFVHGIIFPNPKNGSRRDPRGYWAQLWGIMQANRMFFGIVVLPTLIVALYYGLVASDQYESSADFIVRRSETTSGGADVGQLLGFNFGASQTSSDAYMVQEYLLSHDAVARLQTEDNLTAVFRRDGTDWISRLWWAHPAPERLLEYYRKQVNIEQDSTTGIVHLTVHTFRPDDSYRLGSQLLKMGEEQINAINDRTYKDNVASSERELATASKQLADVQARLTNYRRGQSDVDPETTGRTQLSMVTTLTASLVQARAHLQAMSGAISHSSPQYQAVARQVAALEAQVAGQNAKISGPDHSVATRLSDYEELVIQREQIAKVYAATAVRLEQAKAEAKRKQLYLIRVVQPNMPVKSQFPKRIATVFTVFAALFFAYAIGWLLWAGVKEHSL
ncbi:lipopolysaccharide biosynthesis protein [Novosphingobium sediminicola]|uniref:Capsular polysaccharide transport system permease protein n=1 Tax=Novosphingobium sediminicola TaxID=563162 RepID=A0A7W6G8C2_9SPHN|nr:lipopolysaccharide biosynthesis protein [Novosphingobium sediminicola]MBB3957834.1 capsular polysaccharide transport system permease protein [Novosphingobium sediminicola]